MGKYIYIECVGLWLYYTTDTIWIGTGKTANKARNAWYRNNFLPRD
jgi:hypothetical protein